MGNTAGSNLMLLTGLGAWNADRTQLSPVGSANIERYRLGLHVDYRFPVTVVQHMDADRVVRSADKRAKRTIEFAA